MSADLRSRITRAMADVFDVPEADISADSTPETLEPWDSVNHLNLVMALEQIFGVTFELDEIPELTSLDAMAQAIGRHRDGDAP